MTPFSRATLPILATAALMGLGATIQAEEIDVLTLKNGKVLEGHYNPATKAFFFGGGIIGSVQVDPADIVKQTKGTRPDPGEAPAEAPAVAVAAPATTAPGTPVATTDPAADPAAPSTAPADANAAPAVDPAVAAKRALAAYNAKHAQLTNQLKSSADYQRLYEANIAKFEAEQDDLPRKIAAMQPRINRARSDLSSAQSSYDSAQSEYDSWRRTTHSGVVVTYTGTSVGEARNQRDRAQRALNDILDEEKKAHRRSDQVVKDLAGERSKLQNSIDKQAKLREELATLEANPPAGAP